MKRKFKVFFDVEVVVELDQHVIDVVDDEWRASLYNLVTPEDIAKHIASNLVRGAHLSALDGWADQPDNNVSIIFEEWECGGVEEQL